MSREAVPDDKKERPGGERAAGREVKITLSSGRPCEPLDFLVRFGKLLHVFTKLTMSGMSHFI